ncbi:MAG: hypothetical protein J7L25_06395 [Deltaproteobacteria bacterium]|nr:hypothetical protein [Candidatus Tharpella aukensis]
MILNNRTFIKHKNKPEWGLGKVTQVLSPSKFRAFFLNSGMTTLLYSPNYIEIIDGISSHPLLDNVDHTQTKTPPTYKSMKKMVDIFLKNFPEGFNDEKYISDERQHKLEAGELLTTTLNQEKFQQLLDDKDFAEIAQLSLSIINKTNLIFPNEKISLKEGLTDDENRELFCTSLFLLLYGDQDIKSRFINFAKTLTTLKADKWTTQTYFLYLSDPDKYLFLKPTVTKKAAEICAFQLHYDTKLNWETYRALLDFGEYFKIELKEYGEKLTPKDMIDVQSFFWCVANADKHKKSKKSAK